MSVLIEGEIQGTSYTKGVYRVLVYPGDKLLAGPAAGNTYAVLKSLDLVCDDHMEQQLWSRAVCSILCIYKC